MNKIFKLKERGTNVKTELIAALTTFFAMAYIIFVNPNMLSATGMDFNALVIGTCISAAIGCFLTAFLANVPFAQAPGMGLNAFFTYTVCFGMGFTWQQALAIVFISGIIFLIVTITPLRGKVIAAIPAPLKAAIGAGIGLFLAIVGLCNAGILNFDSGIPAMNALTSGSPLLCVIGLAITAILVAWKVKGGIFIAIIVTTIIGIPLGITAIPESVSYAGMFDTFGAQVFAMDFNFASVGILSAVTAIVSFFLVDMFDTIGTLIGTATSAGMVDEEGNLPGGDKALIADAVATCAGACLGTSTVTTYVESATGIEEGGKTGLTSFFIGILFIIFMFLAPVAGIIPSAATAPAVIIVGVFMIRGVKNIDWTDMEIAIPAFLAVALMPFTYSISNGIGISFIAYMIIKIFRGKAKEVHPILYVFAILFIIMFILQPLSIGA